MDGVMEHLKEVGSNVTFLPDHLYGGKTGAKRLAREIGWCSKDNIPDEAEVGINSSYNYVCVIGYNLNPPLNKKEWDDEVRFGYSKNVKE